MDSCIFCKIIQGEISAYKILEDENFLAFLTIAPINPGHTLIIPKSHTDYIFDMDDQLLSKLLIFTKPISNALLRAFAPASGKIGVIVAGLEVSHTHIHLIPLNSEADLNFSKADHNYPKEKLASDLEKIKNLPSAV